VLGGCGGLGGPWLLKAWMPCMVRAIGWFCGGLRK
jgi:hypothetical protein